MFRSNCSALCSPWSRFQSFSLSPSFLSPVFIGMAFGRFGQICLYPPPCLTFNSFFSPFLDAEVHYINMAALTKGNLHSSFWVVDRKHFYIGSASMDWRSLATVLPPYFTIHTEILTETMEKNQPTFTSVISEEG